MNVAAGALISFSALNAILTFVNWRILSASRAHMKSLTHTQVTEDGEMCSRLRTLEEGQLRMNQSLMRLSSSVENVHSRLDRSVDEIADALRGRKWP